VKRWTADERVLKDPAPLVAVGELGDSSVDLFVRPWVKASDLWPTRFALIKDIKERFDKEGITIPFPQRDVHLFQPGIKTRSRPQTFFATAV
jgi:small conductance mechanosensitive channel